MEYQQVVIALNGSLNGNKVDYSSIIDLDNTFFIAADGGLLLFEFLSIQPDVILGDFDSLTEDKIMEYQGHDVEILKFPVEKDETDGELALKYCCDNGLNNIVIIGALGGRFDQQLANIFLLEYAYNNGMNAVIKNAEQEIGLIKGNKTFHNCTGSRLSLLPLSKKVSAVSTKGCKYELDHEELWRYKTRGISNIINDKMAVVDIAEGELLYILSE